MSDRKDFQQWQRRVDELLAQICGLVSDDLPDFDYAAAYQSGESPAAVARQAIRAAGDF